MPVQEGILRQFARRHFARKLDETARTHIRNQNFPARYTNKNGGRKAPVQIASVCRQDAAVISVASCAVPFSSQ